MWQTALRGYGGDWALSQYFVFYYLQWGEVFRPEDIYAGNLLSALESVDTGVTTTLDWSHGAAHARVRRGRAAGVRARSPAGSCSRYGNYLGAPWEWSNSPGVPRLRRPTTSTRPTTCCGLQLAFDVPGAAEFPERGAFEAARELGLRVTTHAGVWGATTDTASAQMYDAGFMTDRDHATCTPRRSATQSYQKIAATGGTVSVATESEQSAGQGYPSSWAIRKYGIPASLSMDTSVWWSADFFSAMRATLSADRSRDHLEAHARRARRSTQPAACRGRRAHGDDGRGEVARHGGHDRLDHAGQEGRRVLIKNDESPAMTPILNPYAHVVYQAGTADVHTVVVNGRVVKYDGSADRAAARAGRATRWRRPSSTCARSSAKQAWDEGMHPETPTDEEIENPYTYTEGDARVTAASDD